MTFKKDSIIVSKRDQRKGGSATVVWLKEDFTPGKDKLIWYHNYYDLKYKRKRRNVISYIFPKWEDGVGGSLNYLTGETWYSASKEIIRRVQKVEEEIKEGLK